jgi:hypothetical protein
LKTTYLIVYKVKQNTRLCQSSGGKSLMMAVVVVMFLYRLTNVQRGEHGKHIRLDTGNQQLDQAYEDIDQ